MSYEPWFAGSRLGPREPFRTTVHGALLSAFELMTGFRIRI